MIKREERQSPLLIPSFTRRPSPTLRNEVKERGTWPEREPQLGLSSPIAPRFHHSFEWKCQHERGFRERHSEVGDRRISDPLIPVHIASLLIPTHPGQQSIICLFSNTWFYVRWYRENYKKEDPRNEAERGAESFPCKEGSEPNTLSTTLRTISFHIPGSKPGGTGTPDQSFSGYYITRIRLP